MTQGHEKLLLLERVSVGFGGLQALTDVSFEIAQSEIFALIGPNGAGKTTVFNLISGLYKPDSGQIRFLGHDLAPMRPDQIARLGIGRTFQNLELFSAMTLEENLLVACDHQSRYGLFSAGLSLRRKKKEEEAVRRSVTSVINQLGLKGLEDHWVIDLPFGLQKKLELGRALMMNPTLLLLDEPAAGLNLSETEELTRTIRKVRDERGMTILLVEHDMRMVMGLVDRICVLHFGEKIAEGTPKEIQDHPKVVEAYLGEKTDADLEWN